jgi:DNA (cytosine-5)-methyltransferase 1
VVGGHRLDGAEVMLYGMDICAGSGIGSAAFEAVDFCRTVCYVERDAYCQRLLRQRMQDGWLQPAPIWDDLRTFDGRPWRGLVDFVFGGIPCQPHSLAGKRRGGADERDLWPDFWRVVREVGPRIVLVENVPGILSTRRNACLCGGVDGRCRVCGGAMGETSSAPGWYFGTILRDLASGGYDAEWGVLSARGVGAPHRRERVWLVAYAGRAADGKQHSYAGTRRDISQSDTELADTASGGQPTVRGPQGDTRQPNECVAIVAHTMCGRRRGGQDEQRQQETKRVRLGEDGQAMADTQVQPIRPGLCESKQTGQRRRRPGDGGSAGDLPDAIGARLAQRQGIAGDAGAQQPTAQRGGDGAGPAGWWELEPGLGGGPDGLASWVDVAKTIDLADRTT